MARSSKRGEERFFLLKSDAMATLREELTNLLDNEMVKALMFRYGFKSGELMAEHLNLTEKNYKQAIGDVLVQTGLGQLQKMDGKNKKKVSLVLKRCIESEIYDDGWGCHFTRGYLAGFFTNTLKIPYYCDEIVCAGDGKNSCVFVLKPQRGR